MSITDIVEKRVVFSIARTFCVMLLGGALAAIVVVGIALAMNGQPSEATSDSIIPAAEVLSKIPGSESANDLLSTPPDSGIHIPNAAGFVIPEALHAVLTNNYASQPVLDNWLGNVPEMHRQQFLNELSVVVALATQHAATWEWDNRQRYVAAAMSQYAHMKIDRLEQAQRAQISMEDRNEQYRMSVGVLLVVIGILTMLLVLLAIERNTRPATVRQRV